MWRVPLAAVTVLIVFTALRKRCLSRADTASASTQSGATSRRLARGRRDIELVCRSIWRPADSVEAEILLSGADSVEAVDDIAIDIPETGGSPSQTSVHLGYLSNFTGLDVERDVLVSPAFRRGGDRLPEEHNGRPPNVAIGILIAVYTLLVMTHWFLRPPNGIPVGSNVTSNITDGPLTGGHAASLGTPSTPTPVGDSPASWPTTGSSPSDNLTIPPGIQGSSSTTAEADVSAGGYSPGTQDGPVGGESTATHDALASDIPTGTPEALRSEYPTGTPDFQPINASTARVGAKATQTGQ